MSTNAVEIRPGQRWKSKSGGFDITLGKRASGNRHWLASRKNGSSHKIHEGTLLRYYERLP